jgi:TatA/E family protein of Tat protein translocase
MPVIPDFGLAISMPGGFEWIVILIVALLLFGKKLPEVMRGLGGSVREFKKGMEDGVSTPPATPPAPPVDGAVSRGQPQPPAQPGQNLPDR